MAYLCFYLSDGVWVAMLWIETIFFFFANKYLVVIQKEIILQDHRTNQILIAIRMSWKAFPLCYHGLIQGNGINNIT